MTLSMKTVVLVLVSFMVQSASGVRRRLTSVSNRRLAFAAPNYTFYHRQDDLLHEVASIVKTNPDFMKMEVFTEEDGSYKAELKVVTVEPWAVSQQNQDKVRILIDFGEHGRELISSELGLLLLRTLADPEALLRVFPEEPGRQDQRGKELQRLLRGIIFKILPMENEGGRRLVEAGQLCERKNGRGVDPNRNWVVDWGKKEPDYDPAEEYPGTQPFSEPEVKIVRKVATDFSPHVWLNIHSGMEAMLAPWDHKPEIANEARPAVDLLERVRLDIMPNTSCVVGSGGKSVGYLAHGTATDYMFQVLHVPIASTWEIYGDFQAHVDDCFRMFNPLDEKGVQDVLQRWLKAILRLIELLPTHPALKDSKAWSEAAADAAAATTKTSSVDSATSSDGGAGSSRGSSGGGGGKGRGQQPGVKTGGVDVAAGQAEEKGEQQGRGQGGGGADSGAATHSHDSAGIGAGGGTADSHAGQTATAGSGSAGGSSLQQTQQQQQTIGQQQKQDEEAPRLTVVASNVSWGGGWGSEVVSGLLAVAGLAVVGILAFRCLARNSADRRRARGDGYQTV